MQKNKLVGIVDPYSSSNLLPNQFKKYNIDCIAIHSNETIPYEFIKSYKKHDFIDEFFITSTNFEDILNLLDKLSFISIFAGLESGLELSDFLADRYNLKSNDLSFTKARRYKHKMQERIKYRGLAYIKSINSNSISDIRFWLKENKISKYVVKPNNSAGSDNVYIGESLDGIEINVNKILYKNNIFDQKNNTVIVQEFLEGTEYVVDTVSFAGNHFITNICMYEKISCNGSSVVYSKLYFIHPNENEICEQLVSYNCKVLDALGICIGASHSEIMMTKDGPVLIEVAPRMHGAGTPKIIGSFSEYCQINLTVDSYLGTKTYNKKIIFPPRFELITRIVFLISNVDGVFRELTGEVLIKKLPSFFNIVLNVEAGERIRKTVDLLSSPGWIVLMHKNLEQIEIDQQKILDMQSNNQIIRSI